MSADAERGPVAWMYESEKSCAGPFHARQVVITIDRRPTFKGETETPLYSADTIAALRKDADIPEVAADVLAEVSRAIKKFPTWPTDPLHAVAVLGEEFGELTKAVLQSVYEPHKSTPADARAEAIQTAAMALRFLASLERYEYAKGAQHDQPGLDAAQSTEGER